MLAFSNKKSGTYCIGFNGQQTYGGEEIFSFKQNMFLKECCYLTVAVIKHAKFKVILN